MCTGDKMGDNQTEIHTAKISFLNYYTPVIGILGLAGNIFALFILLQRKNLKLPCYRTLTALSCADIVIILSVIYQWIAQVFLNGMDHVTCKIWTYIIQTAALWSSMLIAFITLHKYLAFIAPLKSHSWRSVGRTSKIIAATFVLSLLFNISHVLGEDSVPFGEGKLCFGITHAVTKQDSYINAIMWITFTLNVILPSASVAIMNTLIIRALYLSTQFYKTTANPRKVSVDSNALHESKQNSAAECIPSQTKNGNPLKHYDQPTALYHMKSAVLLVVVTFVFVLLTPPLYLCHLVFSFMDVQDNKDTFQTYVLVYKVAM